MKILVIWVFFLYSKSHSYHIADLEVSVNLETSPDLFSSVKFHIFVFFLYTSPSILCNLLLGTQFDSKTRHNVISQSLTF